MTNQKILIVANWKMHLDVQKSSLLVHRLTERLRIHRDIELVLAPSLLALQPLSLQIDRRKFRLAAQNAHDKDEGAFTGEVSFAMLQDLAHYVIVGHSERRLYFHETDDDVRDKVAAALRNDIVPIVCVGETQLERKNHETKQVLHDQLTTALANVTSEDIDKVVIAYEPVWAISTFQGDIAKPDQVEEAITYIRRNIYELFGSAVSDRVRVLYGGSVDDQTIASYLNINGCNGALVGGASLNYERFANLVEVAYRLQTRKKDTA